MTFEQAITAIQEEHARLKILASPLEPLVQAVKDMDRELFSWGFYDPNSERDEELARKIKPHVDIIKEILKLT